MERMRRGRILAGLVASTLVMNTPSAFGQPLTGGQGVTLVTTTQPTTTVVAECDDSQSSAWSWTVMTSMCGDALKVQSAMQTTSARYSTITNALAMRADTTSNNITNIR